MGLDLTPLDRAGLSPAVQKAVAGPARIMAARGAMPLPTPGELATVLYELALDTDGQVATAARTTASGLPEKVLAGVLGDGRLDARVLDWLAPRTLGHPALFDLLIRNPSLADETVATLAGRANDREVDQISNNEQRLLRHPEIIAAMYTNAKARMSTIDRAVELAVRNEVRVPGLAAWDEIARALDRGEPAGPEADARFAAVTDALGGDDSELTTGDPDAEVSDEDAARLDEVAEEVKKQVPLNEMKISEKIRVATLGNAFARAVLIRDPIKIVALAAIKSPGVSEIEAARYASASSLDAEVIRFIAGRRDWVRLYGIKLSLSKNPKTSISESAKLLPHLRPKDLEKVSKSKGVPAATVAMARKLIAQRTGGGKK
jgi:hypothetical protein